eukprot:gene25635-63144_t
MEEAEQNTPEVGDQSGLLREKDMEIASLQQQIAMGGGGEPDMLLQQEVWALEAALEIRSRENARLDDMLRDFIQQVSSLDSQLAEQMAQQLQESKAQAKEEEKEAMQGKSVEEALGEIKEKKKKKKGKKKKDDDELGGLGNIAEREIERLKGLLGRKDTQLQ